MIFVDSLRVGGWESFTVQPKSMCADMHHICSEDVHLDKPRVMQQLEVLFRGAYAIAFYCNSVYI